MALQDGTTKSPALHCTLLAQRITSIEPEIFLKLRASFAKPPRMAKPQTFHKLWARSLPQKAFSTDLPIDLCIQKQYNNINSQ